MSGDLSPHPRFHRHRAVFTSSPFFWLFFAFSIVGLGAVSPARPLGARPARCQRFGSGLQLNVHLHAPRPRLTPGLRGPNPLTPKLAACPPPQRKWADGVNRSYASIDAAVLPTATLGAHGLAVARYGAGARPATVTFSTLTSALAYRSRGAVGSSGAPSPLLAGDTAMGRRRSARFGARRRARTPRRSRRAAPAGPPARRAARRRGCAPRSRAPARGGGRRSCGRRAA